IFVIALQVAGDLVIVAMAFYHMAVVEDGLHPFGKPLRDRAASQERRLDALFLQNPQQSLDRLWRTVFALAPHLEVRNSFLVRVRGLAGLEIERQKDGGPLGAGPTDEVVVMIFLEHCVSLKWL